ncbi:MAG: hypothetical protein IJJ00_01245 [Erysipelotrichaceae bacterium]|nr:hypothetical protein [Erysipelotrichaceae bacterium]
MKKPAYRNIISGIVIAFLIVSAVFSTLKVRGLGIDPESIEEIGNAFGVACLIPTVFAVFMAFMYKNVILSLALGMFLGGLMYTGVAGCSLTGFFTLSCNEIVETVADYDNAAIILLCLSIGGMIEMIRSSGGFEDLARRMTRHIDTPRKTNLITQLLGILVFFDDYANALIVGPVMQPITDRLKISREKLAYIVDSTAAPVTGIAIISSWVAVEVGVIEEGLANAHVEMSAYGLFLRSIPFCFYCIFCLLFIFISSLSGREFASMYEAECRARSGIVKKAEKREEFEELREYDERKKKASMWTAIIPLVTLFIYAISRFVIVGKANALAAGIITGSEPFSIRYLSTIFGQADTIYIVFEATVLAAVVAMILGMIERAFDLKEAVGHFVKGCANIFDTAFILTLAWTMSSFVSKIGAVNYTVNAISSSVAWFVIPILIFVVCCFVSFAVGSYGCMFIALPMAIPIAVRIMALYPSIGESYLPLVIACGLAGSIFGDHCSPITDCTILSSKGSGCNNFDHVHTQLPYAIVTAAVSVIAGIIPATFGLPTYVSLLLGGLTFYLILKFIGKEPKAN